MRYEYNYWISFDALTVSGKQLTSGMFATTHNEPITKGNFSEVEELMKGTVLKETGEEVHGIVILCINHLGIEMVKDDEDSAEDETTG